MRIPETPLLHLSKAAPPGLRSVRWFSPHLAARRRLAVYLPPGWTAATPVAYLFRGHHHEWLAPRQDRSRLLPLPLAVDRAVRNGGLPPVGLVVPCFGSEDRRFFACGADWVRPDLGREAPGMGLGAFESSFVRDLVPSLEGALGLRPRLRLAIGFSLGGLTALQLALRHPGLFDVAAAYDGSFFHDPPQQEDSILADRLFHPTFGWPRNPARVREHSPAWLARTLEGSRLERLRFMLQSGPEAAEPWNSNFYRTRAVLEALEARGVDNGCAAVDPHGRHDWATADRFAFRVLHRVLRAP